jgi:aminocarboxymuconate-semialdehyde decarboxylase
LKLDVHNHVIPEAAVDLLRRDPVYKTRLEGDRLVGGNHVDFTWVPSFWDPDAKLAELESKGLEGAIVSPAPPLLFYEVPSEAGEAIARATNVGLKDFVAARPDRYSWMAHTPMADPPRAVAVLEEAAAEGAVGVEVGSSVAGRRLDEPEFEVFWAAAERLGLPVMVHPAYNEPNRGLEGFYFQNVIGNQLETTIAVERLICAGVLDHHASLRLLCVHGAGYFPFQAGRLRHARTVRPELAASPEDPYAYRGRVLADTITHDDQALAFLIARMGPENVLLGTDLPFDMASPDPLAALERAADASTARLVAEENAARLFGVPGSSAGHLERAHRHLPTD